MVEHVVRALRAAGADRVVVVVGHGADQVRETLGDSCEYVEQSEQLGTGHAVMCADKALGAHDGPLLVLPGDVPLMTPGSLSLLAADLGEGAVSMATFLMDEPQGYGRIVRSKQGAPVGIVEQKDCTPDQDAIREVNAAVYCFNSKALFTALRQIGNDNAQGEYYLTDVVGLFAKQGSGVSTTVFASETEFSGVNDRYQLAEANAAMRRVLLRKHALAGVTFMDLATTFIDVDVEIGADTVVYPGCVIEGASSIGSHCSIGPDCWIKSSTIGDGCKVFMSHLDQADMGPGSRCGPFSNLRPGARLQGDVKIGNFVEVKNSDLGKKVSASHLTYIGDATIGAGTNVGAGTITCNYDGFSKFRTEIGENAFIGSNSTLIAPIKIGDGAFVAAGSVVTKDVPDDALALGRARQETKEQWAKSWRKRKQDRQ